MEAGTTVTTGSGESVVTGPCLRLRVEVLILECFGVCVEFDQPLFLIQQPQCATKRVRGALTWLGCLAQDAFVVGSRTETDR